MTLTISTTTTRTEQRKIELPAYFSDKNRTEFIAALSEDEFILVSYRCDLAPFPVRLGQYAKDLALPVIDTMTPVSREEFLFAYDMAVDAITETNKKIYPLIK